MPVFISHSHHDDPFATQLAADLRAAGVSIWIDHQGIKPGQDWDATVETALKTCDAMILVLTPRSARSKNVKVEWSYFLEADKPIFPVVVEPCEVPFRLRLHQQVDFTRGSSQALADLLDALGIKEIPPAQPVGAPGGTSLPQVTPPARLSFLFEPEMVLVPGGPFLMGSDKAKDPRANDDELPQHIVVLPDYRIGRYPVTIVEYRVFIEDGGYQESHYWTRAGWQWKKGHRQTQPESWSDEWMSGDWMPAPVVGVSWYEAYAYCQWLAEITGRAYRLPTEAEWEKAARGTDGQIYPWGNGWRKDVCNTEEAGIGRTTPVGAYSPEGDSPCGAADMSGNLWEWCLTKWYGSYQEKADDDPEGTAGRVIRGGAWLNNRYFARAAFRNRSVPSIGNNYTGFRVACAPLTT